MKHFNPTRHPNLLRHDNGNYYVRVRVGKGREACKSLETDLFSIATVKMRGEIAKLLASAGRVKGGTVTLGECAAIYLDRKKLNGHKKRGPLKVRSLDYRTETVAQWRVVVPGFDAKRPALVTAGDLNRWADKAREKYSVTRYNGMIESLRGILELAVEHGACESNLALKLNRAPVPLSTKKVPTREQFTEILQALDAIPERRFARLSVRALAFTGLRPNEARHLKRADLDLKAGTITARETKNGQPRTIQLIDQALELFKEEGWQKVLAALRKDPRRALNSICEDLGLGSLTPYTMRHLHMTALIESGADIASVAIIAGHRDRGVTLLRNYVHARPEHVRKQLRKVRV